MLRSPIQAAERTAVVAILLLFVGIAAWRASTVTLGLDEQYTLWIARQDFSGLLGALRAGPAGGGSLYYILIWAWCAVVGTSELALRIPSILGAAAAIAGVGHIVSRFSARPGLAWPVVAIACSSPYWLYYGTEARVYGLGSAAAAWVLYGVLRDTGDARPRIPTYGLAALLTLAHPASALLLLPLATGQVWTLRKNRPVLRRAFLLWLLAGLTVAAAFVPLQLAQFNRAYMNIPVGRTYAPLSPDWTDALAVAWGTWPQIATALTILAAAAWLWAPTTWALRLGLSVSFAAAMPLMMLAANATAHNFGARYAFAPTVAMYAGFGAGIAALAGLIRRTAVRIPILLAGVGLWIAAISAPMRTLMSTDVRGTTATDDRGAMQLASMYDAPGTLLILDPAHTLLSVHGNMIDAYLSAAPRMTIGSLYDFNSVRAHLPPEVRFTFAPVLDFRQTAALPSPEVTEVVWYLPVPTRRLYDDADIQRFWVDADWRTSTEAAHIGNTLSRQGFRIEAVTNALLVHAPGPIADETAFWSTASTIVDAYYSAFDRSLWFPFIFAHTLDQRMQTMADENPALTVLASDLHRRYPALGNPHVQEVFRTRLLTRD